MKIQDLPRAMSRYLGKHRTYSCYLAAVAWDTWDKHDAELRPPALSRRPWPQSPRCNCSVSANYCFTNVVEMVMCYNSGAGDSDRRPSVILANKPLTHVHYCSGTTNIEILRRSSSSLHVEIEKKHPPDM